MIKSKRDWQGYKNEITDYLDKYLVKCNDCADFYSTYIYDTPIDNKWLIRVPGATRGNINVVNGTIESIVLYEDISFCYEKEVLDNLSQFFGRKIDLE